MWSRKTFKTVQDQTREPTNTPNIPPQAEELQRGPRSCPVNLSPAAGLLLSAKKQRSFRKPWGDAEAEGLTTDPRGRAEVLRCSSSPCCTPGQRVSGGNPAALKKELKSNARKLLGSWRPSQTSHSHSKAHLWVCLLQCTQNPHNERQKATCRAKRKTCWTLQVLLLGQDDESSDRYWQISTPRCNASRSHYRGKTSTAQDRPHNSKSLPKSWDVWECCDIFFTYFFMLPLDFREVSLDLTRRSLTSCSRVRSPRQCQPYGWVQRNEPTTLLHKQHAWFVFKGFWALPGGLLLGFCYTHITWGGSNCNVDPFSLELPKQMGRGQFLSWKKPKSKHTGQS